MGRVIRFRGGFGDNDTFDILQLRAAAQQQTSPAIPATLAAIEPLQESEATHTREFQLSGRRINGESVDMARDAKLRPQTWRASRNKEIDWILLKEEQEGAEVDLLLR